MKPSTQPPTKKGRKPKLKISKENDILDEFEEDNQDHLEDTEVVSPVESLFDAVTEEIVEDEDDKEPEETVVRKEKPKKTGKHFLNNKRFSQLISEYYASGSEIPCDELADMLVIIVQKMLTMPCFINYTKTQWGSDLLSDGYYKAYTTLKARKFDPTLNTSAFSYFSQTIYHAFLNRIKCEKKYKSQLEIYQSYVYDNNFTNFVCDSEEENVESD